MKLIDKLLKYLKINQGKMGKYLTLADINTLMEYMVANKVDLVEYAGVKIHKPKHEFPIENQAKSTDPLLAELERWSVK